jgi:hypothetical protein
MDTGIGAAAAADLDLLTQYFRQALLDFPLNRIVSAGQTLPATVTGTVIANIKPQIPHNPPVPLLLPARYLPRTGNFLSYRKPEHGLSHNASDT